jgi:hypothetical protein
MAFPSNAINAITTSQYCNNGNTSLKNKMPYTHTHTHRRALRCKERKNATTAQNSPLGLSALLNFDQRLDWLCE